MTISMSLREQVRQRANFACEFCGVTETDVRGQLTIDHFQPKNKGGDDSLGNLLYCCPCCNQYKLDYWPDQPEAPQLWNPRHELASQHVLELDDGTLYPLTEMGAFTVRRLRLNRPPLVAHRLRCMLAAEEIRLLTNYRELVGLIKQLLIQQATLLEEQQQLLCKQQELLKRLIHSQQINDE